MVEYEGKIHFINYDSESVFKLSTEDTIILNTYLDSDCIEDFNESIIKKYENTGEVVESYLNKLLSLLEKKGIYQ